MKKIISFSVPMAFGLTFALCCFPHCKKDSITSSEPVSTETPVTTTTSTVTSNLSVDFSPMVNSSVLIADSFIYSNSLGDSYSLTKFNYYVSNIKLIKPDGTFFAEKESYHLIQHIEGKNTFTITGIPQGSFSSMEFLIGVDSVRNHSGAQTGDLDVKHHMCWSWNQGYIFFKIEGNYLNKFGNREGYAIHIGGDQGKFSVLQKNNLNFAATPIIIQANKTSSLKIITQVNEIFTKPSNISFNTYYNHVNDSMFQQISINYKDMFSVDKIVN